ncbi:hypothetical protein BB560_003320 [Smittium megazygosporum]|uniref:Uncharacterized protein n=1 Tax=Smittium megazygosporum TaxID=133381 RepID=A0A2T9ZCE4_9FUNG|nr:hypothetical protein BB560_003320 [Smittium megazygosporum]
MVDYIPPVLKYPKQGGFKLSCLHNNGQKKEKGKGKACKEWGCPVLKHKAIDWPNYSGDEIALQNSWIVETPELGKYPQTALIRFGFVPLAMDPTQSAMRLGESR